MVVIALIFALLLVVVAMYFDPSPWTIFWGLVSVIGITYELVGRANGY